jgi:hypothetical protein
MTSREKTIQQMRQLAAFLELHPELETPGVSTAQWLWNKEDAITAAKMHGAKKSYDETCLIIKVPVAEGLELTYYLSRETVCTAKRVITVTQEAQPERTFEKVVEWECHPLLAPSAIDSGTEIATPYVAGNEFNGEEENF